MDRSVSPSNYPRSPLNEPYSPLGRMRSRDPVAEEGGLPKRPSVQHLPSVGQEGLEYADLQYQPVQPTSALGADAAAQTRNIAEDLHLHAPKPSLPKSSAIAQVQAVTRTDSSSAAQHGIGNATPAGQDHHTEPLGRITSRASFSRPGSSSSQQQGRRSSMAQDDDHGPAELGMRVPINPLMGDVQAPSPAPQTPSHTGQNGEKRRLHHTRTRSGRDALPPGSYGLHGHGVPSSDPFEQDWYAKHPEELVSEEAHGHGVYEGIGSGRGAFAMSSDDLNKIVRDTGGRGAGFGESLVLTMIISLTTSGTTGKTTSYPDEQIGYMASEQYASRSESTAPPELTLTKTLTNASQPSVESPLRRASLPVEDVDPVVATHSRRALSGQSAETFDSSGDDDQVHVGAPSKKYNKITGGEESMRETSAARPYGAHEADDDEDHHVPILAEDEVAKEIGSEHMQAAVSPRFDRRSSSYDEHRSGDATPTSRPPSRPGSIYGLHSASHSLSRFISHHDDRDTMHTPLEDVDEYEPLFADDDPNKKVVSHAERFKPRPDALKHRFPSQDIWEDTPSSAMYQTSVSTPDLPRVVPEPSAVFEHPDQEAARKGEPSEAEKAKLVPKEERLAKSRFAPHLRDDMPTRPGMQPRFPSQDIWEDSPDSQHLVTTVSSPPVDRADEPDPLETTKPFVPPRPAGKSRLGEGASSAQIAPSVSARPPKKDVHAAPPFGADLTDTTGAKLTKPTSPTELKKAPSIPDRPKPSIPPRPAKKLSGDSLSKTMSSESTASNATERAIPATSPPITKAKPQIPARPAQSSKFGGLKGNFMNDLNQKLGLGPPKEKEPEPEVETKPLEDARKGRARGPQRRAPAKSPTAAPAPAPVPAPSFCVSKIMTMFHIDERNALNHGSFGGLQQAEKVDDPKEQQVQPTEDSEMPGAFPDSIQEPEAKVDVEGVERSEDAPAPVAPSPVANIAEEHVDPGTSAPKQEITSPVSQEPADSDEQILSQHPSQSSAGKLEHIPSREETDPNTDAILVNKQTTASLGTESEPPEQHETKAAEEPIELRNEQVSASAPEPASAITKQSSLDATSQDKVTPFAMEAQQGDIAPSADHAAEPMPEQDVSYKQLEEMTQKADGKTKLEDGGTAKVVD